MCLVCVCVCVCVCNLFVYWQRGQVYWNIEVNVHQNTLLLEYTVQGNNNLIIKDHNSNTFIEGDNVHSADHIHVQY